MPSDIPKRWRRLQARDRDILLSLLVDGPASGAAVHDRVGGVDGRESSGQTYRAIQRLMDDGLVESEELDGRTNEYRHTGQAKALLDRVSEEWDKVRGTIRNE